MIRQLAAILALLLLQVASLSGQTTGDGGPDPAVVRVRIGPLWMNPTITIPNAGIDTNVFNDPNGVTPRRDVTVTITPKTDLWLRMGRSWLFGSIAEDIVWYRTYVSERSANDSYTLGWRAALNRVVVSARAGWVHTRARPGFEIDARAQRSEPSYTAAFELRGLSRTFVGVRGTWTKVSFDRAARFDGESLQLELDREVQTLGVTLRHELTPLTTVTLSGGRTEQRFRFASRRDAIADDVTVALNFDPAALLQGSASLGFTSYRPTSPDLPEFRGLTSRVGLSYTLLGATRFVTEINRSVEASYDVDEPYYVLTGLSGSIAQQIYGPVDVVVRAGSQRLAYRAREGAPAAPERVDRVRTFGTGVGYRLGEELRVGFNVDSERRSSLLDAREYEGRKYGTSITYGQ